MPVWAVKSDYNPVEEPSWNSAASFAIGAIQSGASWLSPLGSGAPAVSPSRGASQRVQSEVRLLSQPDKRLIERTAGIERIGATLTSKSAKSQHGLCSTHLNTGGVMPAFLDYIGVTLPQCYMAGRQLTGDTLDTGLGAMGLASVVYSGWLMRALSRAEPIRAISAH